MNIKALRKYFDSVEKWPDSVKLDACSTTTQVQQTVERHILVLEANPGNKKFQPYYDRLIKVFNFMNTGEPNISEFLRQSNK